MKTDSIGTRDRHAWNFWQAADAWVDVNSPVQCAIDADGGGAKSDAAAQWAITMR